MARLPTAKELNLWDIEVPEGLAISVMPPAQEHMDDPFWWDQGGRDPLDQKFIFRKGPGPERTEKLRKVVEDYPRYGPKMFEKCAEVGRVDIIRELAALGASMDIAEAKRPRGSVDGEDENVPDATMEPAITVAADEGHLECVKVLVEEMGVDVNTKDERGATAITYAGFKGHLDIVEWLISHGARINVERQEMDDIGIAIKGGKANLVQLLLNSSEVQSHNYKMKEGALNLAAFSGNAEMIKFVLKYMNFPSAATSAGVDLPALTDKQKDALGEALPHAIAKWALKSIEEILSYLTPRLPDGKFEFMTMGDGAQANCFNATEDAMTDVGDNSAAFALVWETLLWRPISSEMSPTDIKLYKNHVNRRLISASAEGCPQIAQLLVEKYDANINHISHKYFATPLARAAGSGKNPLPGRLAVARYLLQQPGIDIHLALGEYSNGLTPLALAVREGQIEMVRLLLEYGGPLEHIDPKMTELISKQPDDKDITLYIFASLESHRFPVRLLLEADFEKLQERGRSVVHVKLDFKKVDLEQLLPKLQVRKSNASLAADDPRKRPLSEAASESGKVSFTRARRDHLKDLDFSSQRALED